LVLLGWGKQKCHRPSDNGGGDMCHGKHGQEQGTFVIVSIYFYSRSRVRYPQTQGLLSLDIELPHSLAIDLHREEPRGIAGQTLLEEFESVLNIGQLLRI